MIDPKKLADYLERLVPDYESALAKTALRLEEKMDQFDLEKQSGKVYVDMGGIWGRPVADPFPMMMVNQNNSLFWNPSYPPPMQTMFLSDVGVWPTEPTPDLSHEKIKKTIDQLSEVEPAMVRKPSPDYVHTLTGWRGWAVNGGRLEALGTEHTWTPRQAVPSHCIHNYHPAPEAKCQCGYWSFKSLDLLMEAIKSYSHDVEVIGSVEIWGKVVECENGWRSEFAYPKELWLLGEGLESLSWSYGVPVRVLENGGFEK